MQLEISPPEILATPPDAGESPLWFIYARFFLKSEFEIFTSQLVSSAKIAPPAARRLFLLAALFEINWQPLADRVEEFVAEIAPPPAVFSGFLEFEAVLFLNMQFSNSAFELSRKNAPPEMSEVSEQGVFAAPFLKVIFEARSDAPFTINRRLLPLPRMIVGFLQSGFELLSEPSKPPTISRSAEISAVSERVYVPDLKNIASWLDAAFSAP